MKAETQKKLFDYYIGETKKLITDVRNDIVGSLKGLIDYNKK